MIEDAACSISAISYELGEIRDIGEIVELTREPEMLEALRNGGVEHYSRTRLSPLEQAELSLRKTLAEPSAHGKTIDAIIYASESPWSESLYPRLNEMLLRLGLRNAYPIGISLSGCTNFSTAIRLAAGLIRAEGLHNVLMVCSDKAPDGGCRTLRPGVCVYSDGATSCLIGRPSAGEFDVVRISHENSPEIAEFNLEQNAGAIILALIDGIRKTIERALHPLGKTPSDVQRLFLGNFARHIASMYANLSGFADEQCYFDNIAKFAHTYAGDALINLCDSHRSRPLHAGELCLLLGIAVTSWGVLVLRKS